MPVTCPCALSLDHKDKVHYNGLFLALYEISMYTVSGTTTTKASWDKKIKKTIDQFKKVKKKKEKDHIRELLNLTFLCLSLI
jgi:Golgi nucleoside diphosphatase